MARVIEKEKALELRLKGRSINEISERLSIPKSTVGVWCRDVRLGTKQIERLAKRVKNGSYKGRIRFLEKIRKKRMEEVETLKREGMKEIGKLSKRDLFIAGISMYWSEGYTYSVGDQVGFTNSDPRIILLTLSWFKDICGVPYERISLQVKINKIHKNRTRKVENYWSSLTKIPLSQFNKTVLIKSKVKKVYENHDDHYGTLRITVRKGTKLRRKINGWIEGLSKVTV